MRNKDTIFYASFQPYLDGLDLEFENLLLRSIFDLRYIYIFIVKYKILSKSNDLILLSTTVLIFSLTN